MPVVEMKHLTKSYGKSRGIVDLSLEIAEGEIFGFIGPNGAGKSTAIRTLLSFIYPTSGSATIFGKDCVRNAAEIKKNVGYLPAEVNYYDDMKAKDLLAFSAKFYGKDRTKKMKELSDLFELDVHKKIESLSFGNKKKVGIIQALLHEPKLLILDEPTSGLDPLMQNRFFELLRKENNKGTTILFSSHILGEVQKLCDRVAILKDGRIFKIEQIEKLRATQYKKIKVVFTKTQSLPAIDLSGVMNVTTRDHMIDFLFSGKTGDLIQYLSQYEIDNLWIEEPSLEEIFMHYYEKEAE